MATVLHRTTKQLRKSVNTPDFDVADWIINPDLSTVRNVPVLYWKIRGDVISEMNQTEKDAADAANLTTTKAERKATIDRNTALLVETNENVDGLSATSKTYIDDGRTLKTSIDAAADKAALDAVADNR